MLESLTIFTPGGLILYQYVSKPSLLLQSSSATTTAENPSCSILNNSLIDKILLHDSSKNYHIDTTAGVAMTWSLYTPPSKAKTKNQTTTTSVSSSFYVVALYPDILFEGPRQYLKIWSENLVNKTMNEYALYYSSSTTTSCRPDPLLFDKTFQILLEQCNREKPNMTTATNSSGSTTETEEAAVLKKKQQQQTKNSSKQMRQWGDAKVTKQAMDALDMSKTDEKDAEAGHERALQEARDAYLPTRQELETFERDEGMTTDNNNKNETSTSSSWSSSITGLLQQMTGNKVLSDQDLDKPLQELETMLEQKNVAGSIAHELCQSVRQQLVGKKLNSLYRVQTAVQQALEKTLTKLFATSTNVDLLRNVLAKRGMFGRQKRPYVITVMGINGIGKTTTLAKLAYYFANNNCRPLLVAGDTFRSGAVEQLKVHADCLDVELFSQGYAKDPAVIAKAGIKHAHENGHDVVLIDTAGRMQNNAPLMKALGKLTQENQPDFCLLVCEALVGHDGLSQFELFRKATGRIDGLILTKFDTVDKKMGASLTLTHETHCPIVFMGVGQKYHHLRKLDVPMVIRSLFA